MSLLVLKGQQVKNLSISSLGLHFLLNPKVEAELECLDKADILYPVDSSDYGRPIYCPGNETGWFN